jgi:peptidoglycan hydrolase CwlO-like protein
MIPDDIGQKLHDRATRGLTLTPEERNSLAEWYRQMDEAEANQLSQAQPPEDLEDLRRDYHRILQELGASAERIAAKKAENETLYREIVELRQKIKDRGRKLPA